MPTENLTPHGDKLKKAIIWLGEHALAHPEKKRSQLIEAAQLRFNLSPLESEFLLKHFSGHPEK